MVSESTLGMKGGNTKVHLDKELDKEKEFGLRRMDQYIKVNFSTIANMEKVLKYTKMGIIIKAYLFKVLKLMEYYIIRTVL